MKQYQFFATCPLYLEELLKQELQSFGATDIRISHGGASFEGGIETAYRACLWSRIANRILLPLLSFEATKPEDITAAVKGFEWEKQISLTSSIAVDSTLSKTKICTPDYASLSVKDGIVDRARELTGQRPTVDPKNPDIRLHLHITVKQAEVSLDLSGNGLHKRGYRIETVRAAVRENTAAAVLIRAGWPDKKPKPFFDPMCGSGTLLIEAAMIAADIAPGINRSRFGFECWKYHDVSIWQSLNAEAIKRKDDGIDRILKLSAGKILFHGRDIDPKAVTATRANFRASAAAELLRRETVSISAADFLTDEPPTPEDSGLLAVNPPYGERLGRDDDMILLYSRMGDVFKTCFAGWNISVLTGHKQLAEAVGLKADKVNTVYNGGIRCTLAHYRIFNDNPDAVRKKTLNRKDGTIPSVEELSPGALMMYNRLKKNNKNLKKWLKNSGISCYRLYDADMPEYSVAVDIYPSDVIIQEYAPPKTIDPVAASSRLREAVTAVQAFLEIPDSKLHLKTRKKQRGSSQYAKSGGMERTSAKGSRVIITEHGLKFFVDPFSYLDTGIFLDSRPIRRLIKEEAAGKTFLNLFCYTGTASVYAASGGALSTTSVDTSRTYLDWTEDNLKINGFGGDNHSRVRKDCMQWLSGSLGRWDLIYLDPPTFSNSKDREDVFDLQRDHEQLIRMCLSKLSDGGLLIFCCNFRKFRMSPALEDSFQIREITEETLDPDFKRRKSIHRCWKIKRN